MDEKYDLKHPNLKLTVDGDFVIGVVKTCGSFAEVKAYPIYGRKGAYMWN